MVRLEVVINRTRVEVKCELYCKAGKSISDEHLVVTQQSDVLVAEIQNLKVTVHFITFTRLDSHILVGPFTPSVSKFLK